MTLLTVLNKVIGDDKMTMRTIWAIAREVNEDWKKPYFGAVPYLDAMRSLSTIRENYFDDSAESVVMYFLANANGWRGDVAKRVKLELKTMLKEVA